VRSRIAIVLFCLLNSPTRAGLPRVGLLNRRSVTARYSNCERHPVRRQGDDGGPPIREVWLQGEGDEQIEWQFGDGDDYGPRTLCEGSLHRSVESRGAHPRIYWTCLSGRLTGNNGLDDTTRNELGVAATGVALSSGPERKATQG
jgi:hypothetical protein